MGEWQLRWRKERRSCSRKEGSGPGRIELVGVRPLQGPFVMQIRFARHAKVSYADLIRGRKKRERERERERKKKKKKKGEGGKKEKRREKRRLSLWSFLIYPKREQTASRKVRWLRREQEQGQRQQYPLGSARYPQLFRREEQRKRE